MKATTERLLCVGICAAMMTSCTAEQRAQGLGALGGAAGGAAIGALAGGGDPKAIAAGAVGGALVGWGAVKLVQYHAEKTASAQDEAKALGYKPSDGTVVKIRGFTATPDQIRPGQEVALRTDYSVLAPSQNATVPVTEKFELWKDNKRLKELGTNVVQREEGGWSAAAAIPVPKNVAPGTYVVKTRVEGAGSYDERESHFVVGS
jgi:hypothetical protein